MTLPRATAIGHAHPGTDHIALDYEGRLLRRKRLVSAGGREFLVDLPETVSLAEGCAFRLDDGTEIAVRAAPEPLIEVRGDLPRLAWHIGNRHTPCRIEADRLLIRQDHVLAAMLRQLGARLAEVEAPFAPEGGAYGHGRTFGHDHGPGHGDGQAHAHDRHHHE
jgi:urease accessory protein